MSDRDRGSTRSVGDKDVLDEMANAGLQRKRANLLRDIHVYLLEEMDLVADRVIEKSEKQTWDSDDRNGTAPDLQDWKAATVCSKRNLLRHLHTGLLDELDFVARRVASRCAEESEADHDGKRLSVLRSILEEEFDVATSKVVKRCASHVADSTREDGSNVAPHWRKMDSKVTSSGGEDGKRIKFALLRNLHSIVDEELDIAAALAMQRCATTVVDHKIAVKGNANPHPPSLVKNLEVFNNGTLPLLPATPPIQELASRDGGLPLIQRMLRLNDRMADSVYAYMEARGFRSTDSVKVNCLDLPFESGRHMEECLQCPANALRLTTHVTRLLLVSSGRFPYTLVALLLHHEFRARAYWRKPAMR